MDKDWKKLTEEVIAEVIKEKKLYPKAIYIAPNKGKKEGKDVIVSYSICIWEKDYPDTSNENTVPDRNSVIINIKDPAKKTRLSALRLASMDTNIKMPSDIEYVDNITPYWMIEKDSKNLSSYFKRLIEKAVDSYLSKADMFGCCSKFNQCSDARKCLHENQLYSKACFYRKNLEAGKIFYGKNKNT